MDMATDVAVIKQHLIDPEICIRCNTCEATCPVGAITHDDRNYVVQVGRVQRLHGLHLTLPDRARSTTGGRCPCRQGVFDRRAADLGRVAARTLSPAQLEADGVGVGSRGGAADGGAGRPARVGRRPGAVQFGRLRRDHAALVGGPCVHQSLSGRRSRPLPRWWATSTAPRPATTARRIMWCSTSAPCPFPVLEGQSIAIVPPGVDANGRAYTARQYSIASPRNGERPGYNNVSLTVKRVTEDHQGKPIKGVASNYICDLSGRRRGEASSGRSAARS